MTLCQPLDYTASAAAELYRAERSLGRPLVAQARRLGFHLDEIKEVVQIRRAGRCPCPNVLDLVRQKVEELDRTLADLTEVRRGLKELLRLSSASRKVLQCPAGCRECPEVEFAGEQVRVGEAGNLAVLTKEE